MELNELQKIAQIAEQLRGHDKTPYEILNGAVAVFLAWLHYETEPIRVTLYGAWPCLDWDECGDSQLIVAYLGSTFCVIPSGALAKYRDGEYLTHCPKCGGPGLSVVGVEWQGEVPLSKDGFWIGGSKESSTDNEMCSCKHCGELSPLVCI
jgi:hypothetical protein